MSDRLTYINYSCESEGKNNRVNLESIMILIFIKSIIMVFAGYVACMGERSGVYQSFGGET